MFELLFSLARQKIKYLALEGRSSVPVVSRRRLRQRADDFDKSHSFVIALSMSHTEIPHPKGAAPPFDRRLTTRVSAAEFATTAVEGVRGIPDIRTQLLGSLLAYNGLIP